MSLSPCLFLRARGRQGRVVLEAADVELHLENDVERKENEKSTRIFCSLHSSLSLLSRPLDPQALRLPPCLSLSFSASFPPPISLQVQWPKERPPHRSRHPLRPRPPRPLQRLPLLLERLLLRGARCSLACFVGANPPRLTGIPRRSPRPTRRRGTSCSPSRPAAARAAAQRQRRQRRRKREREEESPPSMAAKLLCESAASGRRSARSSCPTVPTSCWARTRLCPTW